MWPFRRSFRAGLRWEARRHSLCASACENDKGKGDCLLSVTIDSGELVKVNPFDAGRLVALILLQAEKDGASEVRFHYNTGKLWYTVDWVDYEMVPPPIPVMVGMIRWLVNLTGVGVEVPGILKIRFRNGRLQLVTECVFAGQDPFLRVTGFSPKT